MKNYEQVSKGTGFTMELSWISRQFLEFSHAKEQPVCDIGAAYGVATIPALEQGNRVIAIEQNAGHLETLRARVPQRLASSLTCIPAHFPDDRIDIEKGSCAAVLCSHMLAFLSGARMEKAIPKIYDWLAPQGKLFVINFTPYNAMLKSFIPDYEERKRRGENWPGWLDDIFRYAENNEITRNLPVSANYFDRGVQVRQFEASGFTVDFDDYLTGEENLKFPESGLDGRELHGMILTRP